MSFNYLVYHNTLATVVAAYWDDGYNLATLGLGINTVSGPEPGPHVLHVTASFSCKQGYLVIYIALMLPILPEAACLDSTGIGESE